MDLEKLSPEHARIAKETRDRITASINRKSVADCAETATQTEAVQREDELDSLPIAN